MSDYTDDDVQIVANYVPLGFTERDPYRDVNEAARAILDAIAPRIAARAKAEVLREETERTYPHQAAQTVVVSWSGRRHYKLTGGRVLNDGSARAMCSDATYGREPDDDGDVTWGTKRGKPANLLPMCKSCVRSAGGPR